MATGRRRGEVRVREKAEQMERLGEWFAGEYGPLLRFAYFLTGDQGSAEDLVQDSFLRIFFAGGRIEDAGFPSYARKTVLNLARSSFRRAKIRRQVEIATTAQSGGDPADAAATFDLRRALLRLPLRHRACLALRYYEDKTDEDIADVLGTSTAAVRKQIERAMKRLRQELGEDRRDS